MKKVISLIISAAMLMLSLASCGGNANVTTVPNATTEASTVATSATTDATTEAPKGIITVTPKVSEGELVAHWNFSEVSAEGTVADLSGNGHTGTVSGNVELVDAKDGKGAKFSGDGAMISVEDSEKLHFKASQDFTLEVRFKIDSSDAEMGTLIQKGYEDEKGAYFGLWVNNEDKLTLGTTGKKARNFASNSALDDGWHHAVIIQSASSATILFYLDGNLQTCTQPKNMTIPLGNVNLVTKKERLTIGSDGTNFFSGIIDDVKIYNYAVDESEILGEYNSIHNMARGKCKYENTETNESYAINYRVHYPENYDENDNKTYPIVLILHGHGETGKDNVGQLRVWGNCILDIASREDVIIVVPQCVCDNGYAKEWIESEHKFNLIGNRKLPENPTLALAAVAGLMNHFIESGKVDTNRVYAMGSSMGACGIWELMVREKGMFSAALLMCGAGIPSGAENLVDVDIWSFHGTADTTVPPDGTRNMENAIKEAGGTKMKATYLEGIDHNCMNYCFEHGDILGWLISQTKAD